MVLKYTCPACRAEADLDAIIYAAVDDAEARRLVEYLLKTYQPTLGADTLRYLRMHTPAKQRLTWARVRKVLGELVEAMRGRKITRAGRDWAVSVDDWAAAYKAVFEAHEKGTLVLPLKDNAYLYAILVRMVDKTEAIAEARAEHDKRHGLRADVAGARGQAVSVADALAGALAGAPQSAAPAPRPAPAANASAAPAAETPATKAMREQIARAQARRQRLLARPDATDQNSPNTPCEE